MGNSGKDKYKIGYVNSRGEKPETGVGSYRENLIKALKEIVPKDKFNITEIQFRGKLDKILKSFSISKDYDLIHFETDYWWYIGIWLKKVFYRKKPKVILTHHGDISVQKSKDQRNIKSLVRRKLLRNLVSKIDGVITVSQNEKNLMSRYLGIRKDKIYVTYNGNSMLELAQKGQIESNSKQEKDYILHVSNGAKWAKNPELLLKSFKTFSDLKNEETYLMIVGNGWLRKEVSKLISEFELQDRVSRKGTITQERLAEYYQKASIYLQTSHHETFCLPIIEAMTFGTPVVSTKVGAIPEIAKEAPVYVDQNPENIASALKELLNNKNLYRKKSEKAKSIAIDYTWENSAYETLSVYKKVLGL